jgi:DNA-binding PadR family transcriptional regulator
MNSKLLRGSLETIVLKMLSDNDELYGYEITQRAKELTAGDVAITEGALYPILHKLEAKGVVSVEVRSIGNRMRKYYSLTENGQLELSQKLVEWRDYVASLNLILQPKLS